MLPSRGVITLCEKMEHLTILATAKSKVLNKGGLDMTSDTIPNTSGIYKITCTATKRIYIGSSSNLRYRKRQHFHSLRDNKHHNPSLQNAWNKYGDQAFTFEVLELVLPEFLTAREQYWLNSLKPFRHKGFNIAHDATAPTITPEIRKKIGDAHRGRKQTPEHIERNRQANLGRKPSNFGKKSSPETIEKIRRSALGRKHTPEEIEKMKGRPHTPEEIEKIRLALSG